MPGENHELLSELNSVSGSAFKVVRLIVRELESSDQDEVPLTIPQIARQTHLSENTVRAKIKELKFKTIKQREVKGKFLFSLQQQYHEKLARVQKLNPAIAEGVQKLNPAIVEPLRQFRERPKKIPERVFWNYEKLAIKSEEQLKRETAKVICDYFARWGSRRAAYRRLLQALRGYSTAKKQRAFAEMFKTPETIDAGVIKYYAWLTGER